MRRFFEAYVSQLDGRIGEDDQFGFCKHLNGMDMEGKRTFRSQTSGMTKVDCCGTLVSSGSAG